MASAVTLDLGQVTPERAPEVKEQGILGLFLNQQACGFHYSPSLAWRWVTHWIIKEIKWRLANNSSPGPFSGTLGL